MLTLQDVNEIIAEYVGSSAGQAHLKTSGAFYTQDEMRQIALRLRSDIVSGFLSLLKSGSSNMSDMGHVSVEVVGENRVEIRFPPGALRRTSLLRRDKNGYTGEGVQDIFALFTQEWATRANVYGYWHGGDSSRAKDSKRGVIKSRGYYPGNPWISHIVAGYEMAYPGLMIIYPEEWGG